MCIRRRAQEFIEKLVEIEELLNNDINIYVKIGRLLQERFGCDLYIPEEKVVVKVTKLPRFSIMPKFVCDDVKGEVVFDGPYVYVRADINHSIAMYFSSHATLYELLALYYIEKCNPGVIDEVVRELRKRNRESEELLDRLKAAYMLLKVALG